VVAGRALDRRRIPVWRSWIVDCSLEGKMSRTVELIIGFASVTMFVGTIAAIPWLVRRLPEDYFVRPPPNRPLPLRIARNVLGFALVAAGIALLVLPGQGVLTILIGLSILDLPIKDRMIRRILQHPKILEAVQHARAKAGKPPLVVPEAPQEPTTRDERGAPRATEWDKSSRQT
jgi:hypothetical protein